jgi:hypothetical protein
VKIVSLCRKKKTTENNDRRPQMKKVFKYGTGHVVPEGAVYLCTKTETKTTNGTDEEGRILSIKQNLGVWHYFLVDVPEEAERT